MKRANGDIRKKAAKNGVCLWRVADKMGIHAVSLSRKMRKELSGEEKERIFQIIEDLARELYADDEA